MAARLLGLRVPVPPGAWISVSCECCGLSGRGLCVELIAHPEELYLMCVCVYVCVSLSCECCGLSGRGLCVGLITRPEESYLMCVCVCFCVL